MIVDDFFPYAAQTLAELASVCPGKSYSHPVGQGREADWDAMVMFHRRRRVFGPAQPIGGSRRCARLNARLRRLNMHIGKAVFLHGLARWGVFVETPPLMSLLLLLALTITGCGTIREQRATEQLLLSDAVDRTVAKIDFSPLAYQKVYLDTRFIQFKNDGALSTNYVISALRQQMVVAGCLLQDAAGDAEYVVEARIGTLGSDSHDMNYGIPASNNLNAAASVVASAPALPTLPEISLARKTEDMAAAKLAVFAYHRETRVPVWQSGTMLARSRAKGAWILGAGPFQWGSIYDGTHFPGNPLAKKKADKAPSEGYSVFRGTTIWDEELRAKVATGEHLVQPEFDQQEASGEGEQISRSNDGQEQR